MKNSNLNELINDFISQRINHICIKTYKKKAYTNLRKKYIKVRDILESELPANKKDLIEQLEELHYSMQSIEFDELYRQGFNDSIRITFSKRKL